MAVGVMRRSRCKKGGGTGGVMPKSNVKRINVVPSPSPSNNLDCNEEKVKMNEDYYNSNQMKNGDFDYSQFPMAFRSYIEETRLEQEETQLRSESGRTSNINR